MHKELKRSYNGVPTFLGFFEEHLDECEKVAKKTGWNENTTEAYRKIVEEKIAPNLNNHDYRPILDYTRADYEKALRRIKEQGQGKQEAPFVPYKESTLQKYRFLIRAVVTVAVRYGLSRDVFSEDEVMARGKGKGEQHQFIIPKSLSVLQEIAVVKYLMANIKENGQAVALLLMYALGLRNAEACGVSFSHICEMKEFPGHYYLRIPQTTQIDKNEPRLGGKSPNAPRNVPIPDLVVKTLFALFNIRNAALERENRKLDFANLPIVCKNKEYERRCSADEITTAGREMFIKIGMRQEDICKLGEELSKAIAVAEECGVENVFLLYEKDPTSYLLRRNFATHMMILGLTETEMMYVIGHEMIDAYVDRQTYTDERMLMEIKKKLDRRPILNEMEELPLKLETGSVIRLAEINHQKLCISMSRVKKIHLEVTAKEPGDGVAVTTNSLNQRKDIRKECGTFVVPHPKRFPREIDIRSQYHEVYKKALVNNPVKF